MQGKILIVDAIATNRIMLKVKLQKAYYVVVQASTMAEAIVAAKAELPDLVISALSLPDGGAADLCHSLQRVPSIAQIPVLAIGCQPGKAERITTLQAGVHDVIQQPVNETLLLARVRSLIRDHNSASEWRMRGDTCRALGLAEEAASFENNGRCIMVCRDKPLMQKYAAQLRAALTAHLTLCDSSTLMQSIVPDKQPDVFVLVLPSDSADAMDKLRIISTLWANALAQHKGVIVLLENLDPKVGAHALDLGADDLMIGGFDSAELALRIKAVMRRKRMGEQLRATVRTGLQAAVFDPLTGLYNRRYAMPHLSRVAEHALAGSRSFAVMAADLDYFKQVNDAYGHASGDAVLIEVGNRLRRALRSTDMVARVGGEEFLIVMSGTTLSEAQEAALRVCEGISSTPFIIPGNALPISVTISIGMAVGGIEGSFGADPDAISQALLDQADRALYAAKGRGRNQVKMGRPAA